MEKVDITIIEAGIIGLAISAALAQNQKTVYTLDWINGCTGNSKACAADGAENYLRFMPK